MASSQPPPSAKPATAAPADAVPVLELVVEIGAGERAALHLLDVGAGGEGLLGAGEDDAADARLSLETVERPVDLADELAVQRVQRLRAVERDQPDPALRLDENGLISHGGLPKMMCRQP